MQIGDYEKATEDFDYAIRCMDNQDSANTAMVYFYRGQVKMKTQ